jgi:chromosome segregation ATPase
MEKKFTGKWGHNEEGKQQKPEDDQMMIAIKIIKDLQAENDRLKGDLIDVTADRDYWKKFKEQEQREADTYFKEFALCQTKLDQAENIESYLRQSLIIMNRKIEGLEKQLKDRDEALGKIILKEEDLYTAYSEACHKVFELKAEVEDYKHVEECLKEGIKSLENSLDLAFITIDNKNDHIEALKINNELMNQDRIKKHNQINELNIIIEDLLTAILSDLF